MKKRTYFARHVTVLVWLVLSLSTIALAQQPSGSASFLIADTSTQGNWQSVYGADGYSVANSSQSVPTYATFAVQNQMSYTWTTNTTDPRALQTGSGSGTIASCWYGTSAFNFDVNFTDGASHRFALYAVDWDSQGRAEIIQVVDANTGAVFDSRTLSNFVGGTYLVWNLTGHVKVSVTLSGGLNPVVSGVFFGGGSSATPAAVANFVRSDTSTRGSWHGVYGANGYSVANDSQSVPTYATFAVQNQMNYTWTSNTTDPRALQTGSGSGMIASCWYSVSTFNYDVNFTDGASHQFALYAVDWDRQGRSEVIQVADANTGAVLDSRTISNFIGGTYLVWDISGHVKVSVTLNGGLNPVVSGVFFDPANPTAPLISSMKSAAFTIGIPGTFTVTASGFPGPTLSEAGALPSGVTFNTTTGVLSGTPAAGTNGSYPLVFTASNNIGTNTQSFTLSVNLASTAAAAFVASDTTTQGNWQGKYGADGYSIGNTNYQSLPGYAVLTPQNELGWTWTLSTTDPRALAIPGGSGGIASCWYKKPAFSFDVNITDGNTHQIALYALDWENAGRAETIQIVDANNPSNVLSTQSISSFHAGIYLAWNISGHVTINVTLNSGRNPVVSGVFFGGSAGAVGGGTPVSVTTASLATGQQGTIYSAGLAAIGGAAPYSWSIGSGALPGGLTLNASTGAISGTPSVAGSSSFNVKVTDSSATPQTANASLVLTIAPATLAITKTSLPNGQVGTAYSQTLTATGGTAPYTWTLTSGALPAGLALNSSTGLISGTPIAAANATTLTFKVTDSGSPAQTTSVSPTLTIAPATLTITKLSLSNGQVGTSYSQTLTATGGIMPYTWTLTSGTLPAGLTLNSSTGLIGGTPTAAASAIALTFKVTDSGSPAQTTSVSLTLTIAPATLTITTASLSNGQVGTSYSQTLTATGGTTPYTWALTSGTLPTGLTLNSSTGLISGTPTATANGTALTFKVTDAGSPAQTTSVSPTLTVASATLTITKTSLSNGQLGTAYSQTLTATGGTTPYMWTLTSGTLPAGLTLNSSTGLISGTPTATANAIALTFKVTDSGSPAQTTSVSPTLTIAPATLTITKLSLSNGQVGTSYSQMLTATGGTTPYTWTFTSGTLPGGLTLNSSTGLISGTPTATANATALTFKVTDSGSPAQTTSVSLTLTIAPATLTITKLSLSNGQVGTAYSQTLTATGGTVSYSWTLTSGTLPAGLTLNSLTGLISGTPAATANAAALIFKVTDSGSPVQTANVSLTLTIAPAVLTITTASLPNGQMGMAYSQILTATGGTTPYTWTLTSGTLPAGLTLNSSTGLISGTPTATANATALTFKVTDSTTPTAQANTASFTLTMTSYSVMLSWAASTSSTTWGYNVYRSTVSGSGYTKISLSPVLGLTYTDTLVVSGQTYYYVVTTVDSSGDESGYSNQIQEVVP